MNKHNNQSQALAMYRTVILFAFACTTLLGCEGLKSVYVPSENDDPTLGLDIETELITLLHGKGDVLLSAVQEQVSENLRDHKELTLLEKSDRDKMVQKCILRLTLRGTLLFRPGKIQISGTGDTQTIALVAEDK